MPELKHSNATFWVIFKHCALCQYCNGFHLKIRLLPELKFEIKKLYFSNWVINNEKHWSKIPIFLKTADEYTTTCIFNVGVENYVRQEQRLCGVIGGKTPLSLLFREITTVTNPSSSPPKTTEYTNHCILSFGINMRTNLQILSFELS